MKKKFIDYYMKIAETTSSLSYARRLQVGAVIVRDNQILATGYNGMPAGWENNCEDKEYMDPTAGGWLSIEEIDQQWPFQEEAKGEEEPLSNTYKRYYRLTTRPEVLHAEMNCLMKVAQSTESSKGAMLLTTTAPCLDCAKAIYQAGIKDVIYKELYRSEEGLYFLQKCGVNLTKFSDIDK